MGDHISRARSVAGWETKLRGTSHRILFPSSLSRLNFQNTISPLGYMVGQNINGQGTCHRDDTDDVWFLLLSTCQYLRDPMSDYAHTWSPVWGQRSRRGHRGQKSIFTKNAISPSDKMVWPWDSCTFISRIPSTKVLGTRNSAGVIWGHRGQRVIFTKQMLFLLQSTWYGLATRANSSARYPLQKLSV